MDSQAHVDTGDLLEDFFPRSLPPQQLNVIPAVRPHFPSAGIISRKLCSGCQPGDSSCLALPSCRGMQTFLGLTREQQSLWRKWAEQKSTPHTPRVQTQTHFFSASTHPLPAASFSRRNFSASRFCSCLLLQGLSHSAAQPSCSKDGVR